jgi:chemotaxis protein histidine kinase CheA
MALEKQPQEEKTISNEGVAETQDKEKKPELNEQTETEAAVATKEGGDNKKKRRRKDQEEEEKEEGELDEDDDYEDYDDDEDEEEETTTTAAVAETVTNSEKSNQIVEEENVDAAKMQVTSNEDGIDDKEKGKEVDEKSPHPPSPQQQPISHQPPITNVSDYEDEDDDDDDYCLGSKRLKIDEGEESARRSVSPPKAELEAAAAAKDKAVGDLRPESAVEVSDVEMEKFDNDMKQVCDLFIIDNLWIEHLKHHWVKNNKIWLFLRSKI